jgi:hypothetical protein
MANGKRRRSRKANRSRSRSRSSRRNPFFGKRRHHIRRRSHRNPSVAGFNTTELLKLALGAGAGVIGSKYVTQIALGANNAGVMGYVGQAVATLALGWLAAKFAGKDAATGVVAGGLGAVALRIYNDNVSGTSSPMSGLGDPDMGRLGIGLGGYMDGSSPVPVYSFTGPTAVVPVQGGPAVMPRKRG